ncbi:Serine hydroxymethyltransferase [Candidatus Bilamarchaeum dharawalense]|uniref:Serine hydroxymethyltransferase n=1 Tax=Candidatus Bilamarchaeum dharawalense TaxID=2885759 RepID=A0A5E4LNP3_9ARCH|nr:Serine hydroxymethyltransferase [Candidatus Bilamarchaeum dharawalense]
MSNLETFFREPIKKTDPEVSAIVKNEIKRMSEGLELIPSENVVSLAVLNALGSVFTNKYSEGYPKKRYYGGNENADAVELLAIERAKKLFGVPHANVQPYSGSPANQAVYFATCKPGDVIMGHNLPDGGHLTHGWKVNFSGSYYHSVPYHVKADGYIDLEEIKKLAMENKPKLVWCGATAYTREFPFEEIGKIADEVGAYFATDIAHISGLVAGGAHKSPVPYADIITTTTHKTLRGPRGAMIMVTEKGLKKDPELADKIDKAVFPGLQGGPHDHQTAAIAVTLGEALKPEFKEYAHQIVKNSRALAAALMKNGIKLVTNGTDNHMILIDLTPYGKGKGIFVQEALDLANITLNKNTIPADPASPFYPSGVRLGTPAITTRGLKEAEMDFVGGCIARVIKEVCTKYQLPEDKTQIKDYLKKFRSEIKNNSVIAQVKQEVIEFTKKFPLYTTLDY